MNEIKLSIAEFTETIKALRDAERGRLLTAMLEYARSGAEPELSGNELYTWGAVKVAVDKQRQSYENKVEGAKKARAKMVKKSLNFTSPFYCALSAFSTGKLFLYKRHFLGYNYSNVKRIQKNRLTN